MKKVGHTFDPRLLFVDNIALLFESENE